MISTILGFGGRIGRLRYLMLSLLLGAVMTALVFAIVFGMMPRGGDRDAGETRMLIAATVIVGPPFVWFTLTLQAKRLRDIGWSPLYVLTGWVGIHIVDAILAPTGSGGTVIGKTIDAAMVLVLLFWPGREPDEQDWEPPVFGTTTPATPTATVRRPATAAASTPVQHGFGRRGLG